MRERERVRGADANVVQSFLPKQATAQLQCDHRMVTELSPPNHPNIQELQFLCYPWQERELSKEAFHTVYTTTVLTGGERIPDIAGLC